MKGGGAACPAAHSTPFPPLLLRHYIRRMLGVKGGRAARCLAIYRTQGTACSHNQLTKLFFYHHLSGKTGKSAVGYFCLAVQGKSQQRLKNEGAVQVVQHVFRFKNNDKNTCPRASRRDGPCVQSATAMRAITVVRRASLWGRRVALLCVDVSPSALFPTA